MPQGHVCDRTRIQAIAGRTYQCRGCGDVWEWDGVEATGVRTQDTSPGPLSPLQERRAAQKGGLTTTEDLSASTGVTPKKARKRVAKK